MNRLRLDVLLPVACVGLVVWGFTHRSEGPSEREKRTTSQHPQPELSARATRSDSGRLRPRPVGERPEVTVEGDEALPAEAVSPANVSDSAWIQEQYPYAFQVGELPPLEETSAFSEIYDEAALAVKQAHLAEVWPEVKSELRKLQAGEERQEPGQGEAQ